MTIPQRDISTSQQQKELREQKYKLKPIEAFWSFKRNQKKVCVTEANYVLPWIPRRSLRRRRKLCASVLPLLRRQELCIPRL